MRGGWRVGERLEKYLGVWMVRSEPVLARGWAGADGWDGAVRS